MSRRRPRPAPWVYAVTKPSLPPGATSPVMDSRQMTDWLNQQAEAGWEFVSYGQTHWNNGLTQEWWVFRRPREAREEKPDV